MKPTREHWARHHRILAGILIVLILVAAGLVIAQDQETLRIRTSIGIDNPRFPEYLARLVGHPLTTGDSYIVHTNGDFPFPGGGGGSGGCEWGGVFRALIPQGGFFRGRFPAAF